MGDINSNRIRTVFENLRAEGKKTLLPFITAGHPNLDTTVALLSDFERRGVRICELGVPFSDPIADGPTIQYSYTEALAGGMTSNDIFQAVHRYREGGGQMALVAMVSYTLIFAHGPQQYITAAAEAGFDGLIVPDLPLEEAAEFEPMTASHGLCNIMLVSPTTPPKRQLELAKHSRGFIYFISVAGITGERDRLPETTISAVDELHSQTGIPICVGFGISTPEMVAEVCRVANGAIVGSAIVRRIAADKDKPQEELVAHVGDFVAQLNEPLK